MKTRQQKTVGITSLALRERRQPTASGTHWMSSYIRIGPAPRFNYNERRFDSQPVKVYFSIINQTFGSRTVGCGSREIIANTENSHVDHDLPVKSSRSRQGGVKDIHAVRAGQHHHVGVRGEPVHLDEQLVQGVLALVIATSTRTGKNRRREREIDKMTKTGNGSFLVLLLVTTVDI